MKVGKIIFFTGFYITLAIIAVYIVMMLIDVSFFTTWITSLTMCGLVLLGTVMMLVGRAIERKGGDID